MTLTFTHRNPYRAAAEAADAAPARSSAPIVALTGTEPTARGSINRASGVPVVGYTWWPLFALVSWAYQRSQRPLENYLLQMGIWDLAMTPDGDLARRPTLLVDLYREMVAGGRTAVGALAARAELADS